MRAPKQEMDVLAVCCMGAGLLMLTTAVDVDDLVARSLPVLIVIVCASAGAWLFSVESR